MIKYIPITILAIFLFNKVASQIVINVPGAEHTTIQSAINAAQNGDTIIISQGIYEENLTIANKSITIASNFIYSTNQDDITNTIITNSSLPEAEKGRLITISGSLSTSLKIIGLTLKNGTSPFEGGAIYQSGCNVEYQNLTFINNNAPDGGAISIKDGTSEIYDCHFSNNSANSGGAVSVLLGNANRSVFIRNSSFNNNVAINLGGAIHASLSNDIEFSAHSNIITNNGAKLGGAIAMSIGNVTGGKTPLLEKNLMAENNASHNGGAVYVAGRRSKFVNNTIVKNRLTEHGDNKKGAAIYFTGTTNFTYNYIHNNIILNNALEASDKEIYVDYSASYCEVQLSYNSISGNENDYISSNENNKIVFGEGNITSDPLFVDFANNNFSLQENSPCIDAGNPDSNEDFLSWLYDEADRDPDGTRLDMGAFYYHQNIEPQIIANFNVLQYGSYAPLTVEFQPDNIWYLTESPTSWEWDFNNDGTIDSYEEFPTHVFTEPGTYSVKLTVSNNILSGSITKEEIIIVEDAGMELETITIDFTEIEFYGNLCDEPLIENGVMISGASSDSEFEECYIYIGNGAHVNGFSDIIISDFAQLTGDVREVSIKFYDNCGINCTGAKAYSGSTIINEKINTNSASGTIPLIFSFTADEENPIDLFHFYGMESGLYTMEVKKTKQLTEPVELTINTYGTGNIFVNKKQYTSPLLFEKNTQITIHAFEEPGWSFKGFTGGYISNDEVITFNITSNTEVSASFELSTNITNNLADKIVYPMPFSNQINVKTANISQLQILNTQGVLLETVLVTSDITKINTSNYTPGIYFIRITYNNSAYETIKAIKK
jgi:predicted outer membrane repeat protein